MDYKDKIKEYFNLHWFEMMRDIARIVSINSEKTEAKEGMPYGEGPYQALMEFAEMGKEKGFEPRIYDNAVGSFDLSDKERQLDILAHLDVVPAGEGWTVTDPFEAKLKEGRLYGRGTADDKGPAVVAMWAMKCVKDLGVELSKSARLVVGTDEECGSSDLPHYYAVEKEPPMTFSPDAEYPVINIEKGSYHPVFGADWEEDTNLPRVTSIKGSLKLNVLPGKAWATVEGLSKETMEEIGKKVTEETKVTFELEEKDGKVDVTAVGYGVHAASPEGGINALTGLIRYLLALPLYESKAVAALRSLDKLLPFGDYSGKALGIAMSDEESGPLTLTFSMMDFGLTGFRAQFDSRCPICSNEENVKKVTEAAFAAEGFFTEDMAMNEPHHVPADSDLVKELLKVYEDYTGLEGKAIAIGGGTYVHHLSNGVAFGCALPGTENKMHGADESAVVEELIVSAEMFAQIIIDVCA